MTLQEFEQEYFNLRKETPSYRYGQHFMNSFGFLALGEEAASLWNEKDIDKAREVVLQIIERYQWCVNDLPLNWSIYD